MASGQPNEKREGGLAQRTSHDRLDQAGIGARFARAERKRPVTLPLPWFGSEPEAGAGGHHRRAAHAHGRDDLLRVDALEVDPAPRGAMRKEMTDDNISSVLAGRPALG
jgi:hypothetical protein